MTGENDGNEPGPDEESGPILLPSGASCSSCHYSILIPVMDPATKTPMLNRKQRICRRVPPTPVLIPTDKGFMQIGAHPVVAEKEVCFEYDEREGDEIIPTALTGRSN